MASDEKYFFTLASLILPLKCLGYNFTISEMFTLKMKRSLNTDIFFNLICILVRLLYWCLLRVIPSLLQNLFFSLFLHSADIAWISQYSSILQA